MSDRANTADAYTRFCNKQRDWPRTRGTMWRSKYLWDLNQGTLERGTRAKSRTLRAG